MSLYNEQHKTQFHTLNKRYKRERTYLWVLVLGAALFIIPLVYHFGVSR